jgi:hypothetical protein
MAKVTNKKIEGKTKVFKTNNPEKYEHAFRLFMQKTAMQEIAQKVGVTTKTLTEWRKGGNWDAKRSSKIISIEELANKLLVKIGEMMDSENDFNADAFAKAVAQLKSLKTKNTVDDDINTFLEFQNWLMNNKDNYEAITDSFMQKLVPLQDAFVQFRIGNVKA